MPSTRRIAGWSTAPAVRSRASSASQRGEPTAKLGCTSSSNASPLRASKLTPSGPAPSCAIGVRSDVSGANNARIV